MVSQLATMPPRGGGHGLPPSSAFYGNNASSQPQQASHHGVYGEIEGYRRAEQYTQQQRSEDAAAVSDVSAAANEVAARQSVVPHSDSISIAGGGTGTTSTTSSPSQYMTSASATTATTATGVSTLTSHHAQGSYGSHPHTLPQPHPVFRHGYVSEPKQEKESSSTSNATATSGLAAPVAPYHGFYVHPHQQQLPTSQQHYYHVSQSSHSSSALTSGQGKLQQTDGETYQSVDHAAAAKLAYAASKPIARKGRWSQAEDQRLRESVSIHGPSNWKQVAKDVGTRTGDQCWKRWNDALRPDLVHSTFTPAEDEILETAVHDTHGRSWSKIAKEFLPGRCGLACKNRFDHIERKRRRKQVSLKHGTAQGLSALDTATEAAKRLGLGSKAPHMSDRNVRAHRTSAHQGHLVGESSSRGSAHRDLMLGLSASSDESRSITGSHFDGSSTSSQAVQHQYKHVPVAGGTFADSSLSGYRWHAASSSFQTASSMDDKSSSNYLQHARGSMGTTHGYGSASARQHSSTLSQYSSTHRLQQSRVLSSTATPVAWSGTSGGGYGMSQVSTANQTSPTVHQSSTVLGQSDAVSSSYTEGRQASYHPLYSFFDSGASSNSNTSTVENRLSNAHATDDSHKPHQARAQQSSYQYRHFYETQHDYDKMQCDSPTKNQEASNRSSSALQAQQVTSSLGHSDQSSTFEHPGFASLVQTPQPDTRNSVLQNPAGASYASDSLNETSSQLEVTSYRSLDTPQRAAGYGLTFSPLDPTENRGEQAHTIGERQSGQPWSGHSNDTYAAGAAGHAAYTSAVKSPQDPYYPASATSFVHASAARTRAKTQEDYYSDRSNLSGLISQEGSHPSLTHGHKLSHDSTSSSSMPEKGASHDHAQLVSPVEERVNDSGLEVSAASMHVPFDGGGSAQAIQASGSAMFHYRTHSDSLASQHTLHYSSPEDGKVFGSTGEDADREMDTSSSQTARGTSGDCDSGNVCHDETQERPDPLAVDRDVHEQDGEDLYLPRQAQQHNIDAINSVAAEQDRQTTSTGGIKLEQYD